MGHTISVRVSARFISDTLANKANATNKVLCRGANEDLDGDQGITVQGCNKGDDPIPKKFCATNLFGGEEGRGAETSNKSEIPQFLCEDRTLQNGRAPHFAKPHPSEQLDDKNGSEGYISSDPNSPREPTLPSVSMGGQNLSISMSPIWSHLSTSGVFKNDEAHSRDPQTYGSASGDLSG